MKSEPKVDTTDALANGPAMPRSSSRRRLLRAGVGASPVVLSVISQPVRAALTESVCRSASAFASFNANIATSAAAQSFCTGNSPETWFSADPIAFPSNKNEFFFDSASTYAVTKPASQGVAAQAIGNPTLIEVIKYGVYNGTDRDKLALSIAAVRLNVAANKTPSAVAPLQTLNAMWTAAQAGGTYQVNSGVRWSAAQIVTWLKTTFGSA